MDVNLLAGDMSTGNVDLTIIVQAYNEEERIEGTLRAILDHIYSSRESFEIVVVDDGSSEVVRKPQAT